MENTIEATPVKKEQSFGEVLAAGLVDCVIRAIANTWDKGIQRMVEEQIERKQAEINQLTTELIQTSKWRFIKRYFLMEKRENINHEIDELKSKLK